MFPSSVYPELAAGSSFKYSLSDLKELQEYAVVRGVHIIGEMDVPSHSAALTNTLPGVFGFGSLGTNQVGICDFTSGSVLAALQSIFDQINGVFPSSRYVAGKGREHCKGACCTEA